MPELGFDSCPLPYDGEIRETSATSDGLIARKLEDSMPPQSFPPFEGGEVLVAVQ